MRCTIFLGFLFVGLCLADLPEIPDLDDLEDLKDRCNTKGGPGTFDKVKAAKTESETCFKKLIDIEKFKNEIEEAKKTGSMDEVFAKYCNKRPELKDCLMKTYDALKPCLEENEKQAINFTADILKQLSDFACFKDGDRIAMFVAEGGVECIKSRAEGIKNCVNETIKFNPNSFSPDTFSDLKVDKKKCNDMKTIQNCIVKDLEDNCDETTPANIVDALFRFVNKIACKNIKERRSISLKRHLRSTLMQNQEMIKTELVSKIRDMCKKNGDEKSFEKLMESFNGVMGCSGNHRLFVTPVDTFEEELVRCTEQVRLASLGCLADSEKYYPDFVLQSLRNLLRFLYANSDKIRGKTIDWEFATCMKDITRDEKRKQMMKCFEDKNNGEIFVIPPKDELCQKTKEFDSCMYDIIKNTCIKDISIHKFFEDFIKAIESPCTEITSERES